MLNLSSARLSHIPNDTKSQVRPSKMPLYRIRPINSKMLWVLMAIYQNGYTYDYKGYPRGKHCIQAMALLVVTIKWQ